MNPSKVATGYVNLHCGRPQGPPSLPDPFASDGWRVRLPPGRPQGSLPLIRVLPRPYSDTSRPRERLGVLVRAGVAQEGRGDPCGCPGEVWGRSPGSCKKCQRESPPLLYRSENFAQFFFAFAIHKCEDIVVWQKLRIRGRSDKLLITNNQNKVATTGQMNITQHLTSYR